MITVRELKTLLTDIPDDWIVVKLVGEKHLPVKDVTEGIYFGDTPKELTNTVVLG